jgi:hypothetical protein
VAWEHQPFKFWILKANQLPFDGAKIGLTLLLIFLWLAPYAQLQIIGSKYFHYKTLLKVKNFDIHK